MFGRSIKSKRRSCHQLPTFVPCREISLNKFNSFQEKTCLSCKHGYLTIKNISKLLLMSSGWRVVPAKYLFHIERRVLLYSLRNDLRQCFPAFSISIAHKWLFRGKELTRVSKYSEESNTSESKKQRSKKKKVRIHRYRCDIEIEKLELAKIV